ncbi:hypothetical protein KVR01_009594 [Diaporthe batatas]|uniref:uncharacterized protein n=1 Tax=Diaporthe batatas TaxID=748121 RepID=UPI001D058BA8|nr:uncharacterized protein KVR01_009594 [Diaporthe batatas]KAG8161330.1 hypothetical protein KVR01_009594 [Diaporthe batatas]
MSTTRYEYHGDSDFSRLAQSLTFGTALKTAPNRLLKSAMAEALSTWDANDVGARGIPTEELVELYRRWGEGGWGIIQTGNIMIDCKHLSAAGDSAIPAGAPLQGERFEKFRAVAAAAKTHGALVIGQVNHPGRQIPSKIVEESISASAVQLAPHAGMTFPPTRAATPDEIAGIIEAFAHAAEYLEAAGFDGVELHAAHGYLLAQFLSPTTNKRTDRYGGDSIANRVRIVTEICAAVRSRTRPGFILAVKLNSVEFQAEGLTTDDAAELAAALQAAGVDYLELSGGTFENFGFDRKKDSTKAREAFFLDFAELVVPALGPTDTRATKVFITGGFRSAGAMVAALDTVDGVGIARPAVQEPGLAKELIASHATGAIKPLPPCDENFRISGFEPFDLSNPVVVKQFLEDAEAWFAKVAQNGNKVTVGYPDYSGDLRPHKAN